MKERIKIIPRRDKESNWKAYNPVLGVQELVKVYGEGGKERWKMGDGKTPFVDLPEIEENKITIDLSQDLEWGNLFVRLSIREDEKQ